MMDIIVTCVWCGKHTRSVVPGDHDTQGDDCASLVVERDGVWYAEGFYGSSRFDMQLFRFVRNPPTERADPVCDDCLQARVDVGDLVFERETNP